MRTLRLLSKAARQMPADWLVRYGFRPVLLETFVEFERHRRTCYKAANWINVGRTTGRGKKSTSHRPLIPIKDVWLYPLHKNFTTGGHRALFVGTRLRVHRILT